jgi:hypothetical protein
VLLIPGQGGNAPMWLPVRACDPRVASRPGPAPRTRPKRVLGDKAYSSRAIRSHLCGRAIAAVIPELDDQNGHRTRRGSAGGRLDQTAYRGRNIVEGAST